MRGRVKEELVGVASSGILVEALRVLGSWLHFLVIVFANLNRMEIEMIKALRRKTMVYVVSFFLTFAMVAIADDDDRIKPDYLPIVGGYHEETGFCTAFVECHAVPIVRWCMLRPGIPVAVLYWIEICLYYDREGNVIGIEVFGYSPC